MRKLSVALDDEVAISASRAAQLAGLSLSAWLSRAAEHELALEAGRRSVAAWEREHGALTPQEIHDADAALDGLFAGAPPRRPKRTTRPR